MPHFVWSTLGLVFGFALVVRATRLNVAVIGAGPAGLASLKKIIDQRHNVVVYEQSESIGGIWYYTDKIGTDQYGNQIYTPMYQGLRSRSPHKVMEFPDFPYAGNTPPYPSQTHVLDYMKSFVEHFKLEQYIKFHHKVEQVIQENGKWLLTVKNLANGNEPITGAYDAVFVCSGLFSTPRKLNVKGKFDGEILHSREFRNASIYQNKRVLVIGGGPSGNDIVHLLATYTKWITLSLHKRPKETSAEREKLQKFHGETVLIKDDVDRLTPKGVVFKDGTRQEFDVIICAIGYSIKFPFLRKETGIRCDNDHVRPLYKQILNIEYPTMAFIGLPFGGASNHLYDLQARFALEFISGKKPMPSKKDMKKDLAAVTKALRASNVPEEKTHFLGRLRHKQYYKELADTAGIDNIPEVYADLITDALKALLEDPIGYRKNAYTLSADKKSFNRIRHDGEKMKW